LSYRRTATSFDATIATAGSYAELPADRPYTLMVVNGLPPTAVTANGVAIAYDDECITSTKSGWCYSGEDMTLYVRTAPVSTSTPTKISITTPSALALGIASGAGGGGVGDVTEAMSGLKGVFQKTNLAKDSLDEVRATPGCHTTEGGALMAVSALGDSLSYLAGTDAKQFAETVAIYRTYFAKAQAEMTNHTLMKKVSPERAAYANALLANALN